MRTEPRRRQASIPPPSRASSRALWAPPLALARALACRRRRRRRRRRGRANSSRPRTVCAARLTRSKDSGGSGQSGYGASRRWPRWIAREEAGGGRAGGTSYSGTPSGWKSSRKSGVRRRASAVARKRRCGRLTSGSGRWAARWMRSASGSGRAGRERPYRLASPPPGAPVRAGGRPDHP